MKRILFGSVLGALSVCAANAVDFQVGSPYVALRVKYNTFDMKHLMDTGISRKVPLVGRSTYGAGVAVGARLFDIVRAEFEYDF